MSYKYSRFIDPYIERVEKELVPVCKEQKQMIQNIVKPVLDRDDIIIDDKKIEEGLTLQKYFPYKLLMWEVFLFALIVGVRTTTGELAFDEIDIIIARGAGKNGFISFLCFYFLSPYHGIRGYNIDLMANSEQQCKTSFVDVYEVLENPVDKRYNNIFKKHFQWNLETIKSLDTMSELRINTSSLRGKDSKRTGVIIYDEKHEYISYTNVNTLKSGLGKMPDCREITITTDGHIRGGVLDKEKVKFRDLLKSPNPNTRALVFWCRIDDIKEAGNPDMWIKANPSLDDFPHIKRQYEKEWDAIDLDPTYKPEFFAKRLNFPIGDPESDVATWEDILQTNKPIIDITGRSCVAGIDLSSSADFTSVGLLFKDKDIHYWYTHTFVCGRSKRLKGIKYPLYEAQEQGLLTIVDDDVITPDLVTGWLQDQIDQFAVKIEKVAVDSYRYGIIRDELSKIGFDTRVNKNLWLYRPSNVMKTAPLIEALFLKHQIIWGDNSLMRWATNNVKVERSKGNMTYGKKEEVYRKTDPFMAFVAAETINEYIQDAITDYSIPDWMDVIF